MADDLAQLDLDEIERRVNALRERMRPLEQDLADLRGQRDQLLTELRRRRRLVERTSRADLKGAMREGKYPTVAELVAGTDSGALDTFVFNLKTGGEVRLGFPGSRTQSLTFTDGVRLVNAADLARMNLSGLSVVGELAVATGESALAHGMPQSCVSFHSTPEDAAEAFSKIMKRGDALLVKASHGIELERCVKLLRKKLGA